jgi:3-methyladenine DNA glycosylase AlkD
LLAKASPDVVIRTALRLANRSSVTCRFVAYEIVQYHKAFSSLTPEELLKLGEGIDSWAAVDCFACSLSGPVWRDGRLSNAVIRSWSQSEDRWWRRAALVSTVALSRRGDAEDVRRVVNICALAAPDRDDMVVKALSWALRELAKKHPDEASKFLTRHRDALAARVLREVQNKITTGAKNRRPSAGWQAKACPTTGIEFLWDFAGRRPIQTGLKNPRSAQLPGRSVER